MFIAIIASLIAVFVSFVAAKNFFTGRWSFLRAVVVTAIVTTASVYIPGTLIAVAVFHSAFYLGIMLLVGCTVRAFAATVEQA